jgi:hypothetical protein
LWIAGVGIVRVADCGFIDDEQMLKAFSQKMQLGAGQPLGGYGGGRVSNSTVEELEINGFSFIDNTNNHIYEVISVDALYPGELANSGLASNLHRVVTASHTHYAPMLDSEKPILGVLSEDAVEAWIASMHTVSRKSFEPTYCKIWRAEVRVPVYRRFDVPDGLVNRALTRWCGMYPNDEQKIDKNLYLFELGGTDQTSAVIAYHACHPVSRADRNKISADYVSSIRNAVRRRFGNVPCLFFLGCCGDIRPNLARKRVNFLPRNRLNWRFQWPASGEDEQWVDREYANAVVDATLWKKIDITSHSLKLLRGSISLKSQPNLDVAYLKFGEKLRFDFIPLEVSHLFHLETQRDDEMRFIVSCADRTIGYLPHPSQLSAGGYEVDGSRQCMGLSERVELANRDFL